MYHSNHLDNAAWCAALRYWVPAIDAHNVERWYGAEHLKLAVFALDLLGPGETGRGGMVIDVAECCGWIEESAREVLDGLVRLGVAVRVDSADTGEVRYYNVEAEIVRRSGVLFGASS